MWSDLRGGLLLCTGLPDPLYRAGVRFSRRLCSHWTGCIDPGIITGEKRFRLCRNRNKGISYSRIKMLGHALMWPTSKGSCSAGAARMSSAKLLQADLSQRAWK